MKTMLDDPNFQKSFLSSLIARRISQEYEDMTSAHKKIATYVLNQPITATTLMINDLASLAKVSIATVSRFCTNMGFDGYPRFRKDLISVVNHAMAQKEISTQSVTALRPQLQTTSVSLKRLRNSLSEVSGVISGVNEMDWEQATNVIHYSKKTLLVGFGEFSYLAEIFQSHFNSFTDMSICAAGFGGVYLADRHLVADEKCDVALLIGGRQQDREMTRLCKLASHNGLSTIALTYSRDSKLAQSADISFYTEIAAERGTNNPLLSAFVILDALLRTRKTT